MGCAGSSNTETNDEHKENMNQMKSLANQQRDAAQQMGNLGAQMMKNTMNQGMAQAQSKM